MIQRDIIFDCLKANAGRYMKSREILKHCHLSGIPKVSQIRIEPVRRCLQELRDAGKIDWIPGQYDKVAREWITEALWRAR